MTGPCNLQETGNLKVDLSASRGNMKCLLCCRKAGRDKKSLSDLFLLDWSEGLLCTFPQSHSFLQCYRKSRDCSSYSGVPSVAGPRAGTLSSCCSPYNLLSHFHNLYTFCFCGIARCFSATWRNSQLLAWIISENARNLPPVQKSFVLSPKMEEILHVVQQQESVRAHKGESLLYWTTCDQSLRYN